MTQMGKRRGPPSIDEAFTLALQALAWSVADDARADRLLALTGMDAAELRARAAEPAVLAATIGFLAGHEPDLVACADALGIDPATLVAVGDVLG